MTTSETTPSRRLESGAPITHQRHGRGRVVADMGETVVVRFDGSLEQVPAGEVVETPSLYSALAEGRFDDPTDVVVRAQALTISSVNDQWGVFSRSRVQLLPHQLWVCRQVNREWPFRWLVADDVGLGKTIECGLVLMPLIASGRVRRLLILAPAKLVPQWQYRLKDMFDIRLQRFVSDADTPGGEFWATASMVVASFHTLRDDRRGARRRLLGADPWDLVIVDEAHHHGNGQEDRPDARLRSVVGSRGKTADRIAAVLHRHAPPREGLRVLRPDASRAPRSLRSRRRRSRTAPSAAAGDDQEQQGRRHRPAGQLACCSQSLCTAASTLTATPSPASTTRSASSFSTGAPTRRRSTGAPRQRACWYLRAFRNSRPARSWPFATLSGSAEPCWQRRSVRRTSTRPFICRTMNRRPWTMWRRRKNGCPRLRRCCY